MRVLSHTLRGPYAAIALVCVAIIATVWVVTMQRISFERRGDIDKAVMRNSNLALAFEESTLGSLRLVESTFQLLEYEFLAHGEKLNVAQMVADGRVDFPTMSFLGVANARGALVSGTDRLESMNIADRDFFVRLQAEPSARLFVGAPIDWRATGRREIQVSRRISAPDGTFAGAALAGIDPGNFSSFYAKVDVGTHGLIQLVGLDGIVRARRTSGVSSTGEDMRNSTLLAHAAKDGSGSFESIGPIDGTPRYMSFRVLREPGLIVAVGASRDEVLADAHAREWWYLLGSSFATLFVLAFGGGLVVALRRTKRAMDADIAGEALYRVTYEQAAIGISHLALDGTFLRANQRYCAMTGYSERELLSRRFQDLLLPEDRPSEPQMAQLLESGSLKTESRQVRKDGRVIWAAAAVAAVRDRSGKPDYLVAMVQDITESRQAQDKLLHQAHYDTLTGLPNRVLLFDRIEQTLKQARRQPHTAGLLFVDLDRFKSVNDTLGHETGDFLLREAAARLTRSVRSVDSVARVGSDEFVIVLGHIADAQNAALVAARVIAAMAGPFVVKGSEVFVTASIGIAIYPGDGDDCETLLRNADVAMTRAKEIGRNNAQFYNAAMNERAMGKLLLESDLRHALERGEFRLHFQPKARIADRLVTGFEALLRWEHAGEGLVSPAKFVPLLEESGMIVPVGEWVLRAACAQVAAWQNAGWSPVPVAVNVSAKQFLHLDLFGIVDRALSDYGIDAALLEIEITESDAMLDPEHAMGVLHRLKDRGVLAAIDDFGTGYSSLGYLKRFPIHLLKLDRSFVTGLPDDADDASISRAVVAMAHGLGLKVIAEGVETEAQRSFLEANGCDLMQGYLFSRPLPANECEVFLRRRDPDTGAPPSPQVQI